MREWQQGLSKVVVLREVERSLSLTQPGVHSTQGHTGSFCSQDLTLPRSELTTETCGHPSTLSTDYRARQDRQAVCSTCNSHFLTIPGLSEEFILYNHPVLGRAAQNAGDPERELLCFSVLEKQQHH